MELDNLLAQPKWQILEIIAKKPSSPVKISEEIGTSVAYVSQQLKLLEAVGIVKKERTKEMAKGKPRLIYSISEETFYITALIKNNPVKKKITPTKRQKIVLKIWLLEDEELVYLSEKLFWEIEKFLEKIENIFVDKNNSKIIIISKQKEVKQIVQNFLKESKSKIGCEVSASLNQKYNRENLYLLYKNRGENSL